MPSPKFQRRVEDFVCGHCGKSVKGDGYTNHCPHCLWSKHVDVHPGDRAEACQGLMKPVRVEGTTDAYTLVHHCEACGKERNNKVAVEDNRDALLAVAEKRAAMDN